MRLQDVKPPIQVEIANAQAHPSLLLTVFIECYAQAQAFFGELPMPVVLKQKTRRRVAGDVDLRPAVIVEIRRHHRKAVGPH